MYRLCVLSLVNDVPLGEHLLTRTMCLRCSLVAMSELHADTVSTAMRLTSGDLGTLGEV